MTKKIQQSLWKTLGIIYIINITMMITTLFLTGLVLRLFNIIFIFEVAQ